MATTQVTSRPPVASGRAPWVGLTAALVLMLAAVVVPRVLGWDVHARSAPDGGVPPLHGLLDVKLFGPGTLPALLLAALGARYAIPLAERLRWRTLLLVSYAAGLAWLLALALVDGESGITRVPAHGYEYLVTARNVDDVPAMLAEFTDRIPGSHPRNWVTHVAGHPPGALLFFVALVRVGLGGDLTAGLAITVVAASTAVAVLVTLRVLGAETVARRAAPFLVLGPAAVFMAVSADAVFAAVAAWGLAVLAVAATRTTPLAAVAWSLLAGLLLGSCVLLSYGLVLLGPLAVAVLVAARSWLPLPVVALAALVPVLTVAAYGFAWWEAYPVLTDRYWAGIAADRPASYWLWGNLAALSFCAGPLLGAALGHLAVLRDRADRAVLLLVGAAALTVVVADLSRMSKGEVERIWLPFVPWLLIATGLLPERWRRWGLGLQVLTAVAVQQMLYTSW